MKMTTLGLTGAGFASPLAVGQETHHFELEIVTVNAAMEHAPS